MRIGFVGLGSMGRGMVVNLQKAGHALVVHDLARQAADAALAAGAVWAESPKAVAEAADLVFTSLPMPADVRAVALREDGLVAGFRKGAVWFDLSTNDLTVIRELHATAAGRGAALLDAPVGGNPPNAAAGDLIFWVGGDPVLFERHKPVLDAMSERALHVGPIGSGTITKLAQNMAANAINAVVLEILTLGVKAGVELLPLWEALRAGKLGHARTFDGIAARFLPGNLDPAAFQLQLALKDARLALQLGREAGVPMKLCNTVCEDMIEAMNRGWATCDSQSFLSLQVERAGLPPVALAPGEIAAARKRSD